MHLQHLIFFSTLALAASKSVSDHTSASFDASRPTAAAADSASARIGGGTFSGQSPPSKLSSFSANSPSAAYATVSPAAYQPTGSSQVYSPSQQDSVIKILPLPIPVGLPVPSYGYGYGSSGYGYSGYGYDGDSYQHHGGLFAGFGGPLSSALKERKSGYYGLGFDQVKASLIAGRSNPLIHLLAAPYIKNIKENGGRDLPSLEDFQQLLERSSFGLTGAEDNFSSGGAIVN